MILAMGGRRVDAPNVPIRRFPQANEELVRERIRVLLQEHRPSVVVASAAAGADLICLEETGRQGIRRRVILPVMPARFRASSVADRGEEWGRRFDAVCIEIEPTGDLIVYPGPGDHVPDASDYSRGVRAVLDESLALARAKLAHSTTMQVSPASGVMAVVVWDGVSHGEDDMSAAFISEARTRGIAIHEISTL